MSFGFLKIVLSAALALPVFLTFSNPAHAQANASRAGSIRACNAGDMYECGRTGNLMMEGVDGPKDPAAARQYYERACNGEVAISCQSMGVSLVNAHFGGAPNAKASLPYYAKACQLGAADACSEEGLVAHQLGDFGRARSVSVRGCLAGSGNGCHSSGIMFETGIGGAADRNMAAAYYNQACQMNNQGSCQNLAAMRREGSLSVSLPVIRIVRTTPNEGRRPAVAARPAEQPNSQGITPLQRQYLDHLHTVSYHMGIGASSMQLAVAVTAQREKCVWLRDALRNLHAARIPAQSAYDIAVRNSFGEPMLSNSRRNIGSISAKIEEVQGLMRQDC